MALFVMLPKNMVLISSILSVPEEALVILMPMGGRIFMSAIISMNTKVNSV